MLEVLQRGEQIGNGAAPPVETPHSTT
jgi:hypothetical protein